MVERELTPKLRSYAKQFPVITLTGPRQSGKTTLCRHIFGKHRYFSLENLDVRRKAMDDPRAFLEDCLPQGAILDEIQRAPELPSYIQEMVDRWDKSGVFILTGSQNFQVFDAVSQSLAGRTALATLLPFSLSEAYPKTPPSLDTILFKGFYPRIHDKKLNPTEALAFYISTYLERDMRRLVNIKDLNTFEIFLKLVASRTGQILNMSALANDCGVSHNTIRSWLSVLEASYIIHFVYPHHKNFRKRLIKSPKVYFVDVGLASYLLDITEASHVAHHPLRGALFETLIVSEVLKARCHAGQKPNLYYFRDNVGNEVDLVLDDGLDVVVMEIKSGKTFSPDYLKGIQYYKKLNAKHIKKALVVYGGTERFKYLNVDVIGMKDIRRGLSF